MSIIDMNNTSENKEYKNKGRVVGDLADYQDDYSSSCLSL